MPPFATPTTTRPSDPPVQLKPARYVKRAPKDKLARPVSDTALEARPLRLTYKTLPKDSDRLRNAKCRYGSADRELLPKTPNQRARARLDTVMLHLSEDTRDTGDTQDN